MSTSRWRSSLANIETRLRRGLGIAGPINLELPDPAPLTPVLLADDLTRPGTASSLRGRYWRVTQTVSTAAAGRGTFGILCVGASAQLPAWRPNIFDSGANVDAIEISAVSTVAGNITIGVFYFPTVLVLAPGLPIAIGTSNVFYVDPMRVDGEPAPLQTGNDGAVDPATGGGRKIWESRITFGAAGQAGTVKLQPADIFLNDNSALLIGITANAPGIVTWEVSAKGRVF